MPEAKLTVSLIACTPEPEKVCALAARTCYSAEGGAELLQKVQSGDQSAFLRRVMASGHLSVLEHASFTFSVEGVSRVLLAQLTRHRIASFAVQSQRYVSLAEGFSYIIPPAIKALGGEATAEYTNQMAQMHEWYCEWQEKLGKAGESANEDARCVLPSAAETHITLTMNARELLHFFSLRCCRRAQWEIREMAIQMLKLAKAEAPTLFEKAGPSCVSGACPEGAKSCSLSAEMREYFIKL